MALPAVDYTKAHGHMRYSVNDNCVTHDRLQDEVIIINVATGSYYSGCGTAADVWSLIVQDTSVGDAARKLAAEYACDEQAVLRDVDKCVGFLLERGLLRKSDGSGLTSDLVLPDGVREVWASPKFDEYTDMWDLIKLDPIHEADEAGWPSVKP